MKPKVLLELLLSEIKSVSDRHIEFCIDPNRFFIRNRKLSFMTVMKTIIGMESKSLSNELINAFDAEPDLPSASAFVQQRCKIKPEAFKAVFDGFTSKITEIYVEKLNPVFAPSFYMIFRIKKAGILRRIRVEFRPWLKPFCCLVYYLRYHLSTGSEDLLSILIDNLYVLQ